MQQQQPQTYREESAGEIHSALFGDSPIQSIAAAPHSAGAAYSADLIRKQTIPTPTATHTAVAHIHSEAVLPSHTKPILFTIPLRPVVQSLLPSPTPGRIVTLSALDISEVLGTMNCICNVNAFIYANEADATRANKREDARVCKKAVSITGTNPEPMAASIAISPGIVVKQFAILNAHLNTSRASAPKPDRQQYELMATLMMTSERKTTWQAQLTEGRTRSYQTDVVVPLWTQSHHYTMDPLAWFLAHEMHTFNKDVDCLCRTLTGSGTKIRLYGTQSAPFQMYLMVTPDAYCRVLQDLSEISERSSHVLTADSYLVVEIHPTDVRNTGHLIDITATTKPRPTTIKVVIESTLVSIDETTTIIGTHVFYRDPDGDRSRTASARKSFIYRMNAFAEYALRHQMRKTQAVASAAGVTSGVAVQRGPAPTQPLAR